MIKQRKKTIHIHHSLAFDLMVYLLIPLLLILMALQLNNRILFTTKGAQPTITATLGNNQDIQVQTNTIVPVSLQLSTSDNNKISGAELYLTFNTETADMLVFEDYADTTQSFTKAVITEVKTFNGMKLLHLVLIADKKEEYLSSQALLTLRFKANKKGTDRVILLTAASTVVGPIPNLRYDIAPQNTAQDTLHATIMVSDEVQTTPTTAPTTAPAATATPSSSPSRISPTAQPSPTLGISPSPMLGISPTASAQATATPSPSPTTTPTPTATPTATTQPSATPTSTPTATPTPQNNTIQVNLSVRFQGITKKPTAAYCQNKKVKVTIKGSSLSQPKVLNDIVVTANNQGVFTGSFSLTDIQAGNNYTMAIKGPQHLQRIFTGANFQLGENTVNLTSTPLFVGDFPLQDGVLNQQDVQFLRSRVLVLQENQAADLNCDGVVNGNDYSLLIESMKIKYDDEQ